MKTKAEIQEKIKDTTDLNIAIVIAFFASVVIALFFLFKFDARLGWAAVWGGAAYVFHLAGKYIAAEHSEARRALAELEKSEKEKPGQ